MSKVYNRIGFLSSSTLKIIACIFMVIDHVGLTFFPEYDIFRILGRLAFPLFAFLIAEGSRYTKNKIRRFSLICIIGLLLFAFYYIYDRAFYGNIFLTFSLSIFVDNFLFECKKAYFDSSKRVYSILLIIGFTLLLVGLYFVYTVFRFEYGFFGMLLPVIINLFNFRGIESENPLRKLDNHTVKLILAFIGMILISIDGNLGLIQYYCLLAIIPLAFYNGKPGNKELKYAFYIFYPAHLVIIEGIAIILSHLS